MSQIAPGTAGSQDDDARGDEPEGVALDLSRELRAPARARRSGDELDWRMRSLRTGAATAPGRASRVVHRRGHHRPILATALLFVAVAALVAVVLQGFVVQPFAVRGDAMTPALHPGDHVLVLRPRLLRGTVGPGDIVVVRTPKALPCSVAGGGDLLLRVVAVPGETIASRGDGVLVDGRPLREPGWYDRRFGQLGSAPIRPTTLRAGRYFLLADNRSNACDSRTFGPVAGSAILGKGIAVVGRGGHASFGTL
jgi:signal peptidase I